MTTQPHLGCLVRQPGSLPRPQRQLADHHSKLPQRFARVQMPHHLKRQVRIIQPHFNPFGQPLWPTTLLQSSCSIHTTQSLVQCHREHSPLATSCTAQFVLNRLVAGLPCIGGLWGCDGGLILGIAIWAVSMVEWLQQRAQAIAAE